MKRRNKNIGMLRTTKQRRARLGAETLEPRLVLDSGGGAGQQTPLASDITHETDNQKFVQQAFHDLLGRAADPGGLQYWAAKLDSGAPQGDIARQLTHSDEYYSTIVKPA